MSQTRTRSSTGAARNPQTHQAILASTIEILKEAGYCGVSIESVARRAGASKPTIYRWWPNKAALIAEVYECESEQVRQFPELGSLRDDLSFLLHNLWRVWRSTICGEAFRSVIAEAQLDPHTLAQMKNEFMVRRRDMPRQLLETAMRRGELAAGVDLELLLDMIFGFCWYRLLTEQLSAERDIDAFIDLLLSGAAVR
ncbi:TetR/AcrR family transcriptional regulator [Chromobacterium amazonense]|uniref:TetR/AcrR family transcriptional regulator n=1 Tax=Chromobacterium amazonense TaxID=1382803 RepID=A0ABU8V5A7_9NEIS|nr:TetR/AcrR family transcriptional regulator [Chromobacterium amazonense]KIA80636.1 transcriptional regulator [Chromobacterium piscinae]MDE1716346.1 TetR/AcrR family transcriptional regulator [Chromobacterium amazonense]MDQ4541226.1 TetR/AcrR family transcriptional regulator [Chromobacterium amazonense]